MTDAPRIDPDDERAELVGFLDWFRAVCSQKLRGLDREEATRVATPSGMSMLGLMKHLAWVEHMWFREILLGEPPLGPDNAGSFALDPDDTVESVLAAYVTQCEASRAAVAQVASLEDRSIGDHWFFHHVTLRWMILHMLDETARHAGHLDILRELTDGLTGD